MKYNENSEDCELKFLFTYFLLLEKYREGKKHSSLYYLLLILCSVVQLKH